MKLFKKKIIIYRETSFCLIYQTNVFFFWIFGLKLADIESLFWLKFRKSNLFGLFPVVTPIAF